MSKLEKFLRGRFAAALVAVLVGFAVAAVVLAAAGYNPIGSFAALFQGALGKPKYIANVIIKATPILLTGVGVAFAFQTGLFNIGAEGQYILATILSTIVGVKLNLPAVIQVPLVVCSGVLGGAALGAFIGFLKAKFGIHEVITSIMTNWIMLYLNNFVVSTDTFHKTNSTAALPINPSSYTMILPNWKKSEAGKALLGNIPTFRRWRARTRYSGSSSICSSPARSAALLARSTSPASPRTPSRRSPRRRATASTASPSRSSRAAPPLAASRRRYSSPASSMAA